MKNILLLEDNKNTQLWMVSLLEKIYSQATVLTANNIAQANNIIWDKTTRLNIAIIDIHLPDGSGINLIKSIKDNHPDVQCIVFTIEELEDRILQAFLLGADGFLLKNSSDQYIIEAIKGLELGIPAISPQVTRKLINFVRLQIGRFKPELLSPLTEREKEILLLISKGYKKKEIGKSLGLSENTIKDHAKKLYVKLDINSVAEATFIALNSGLIKN